MNDLAQSHAPSTSPDVLYGPAEPALLREEILADLLEASARRTPDQSR